MTMIDNSQPTKVDEKYPIFVMMVGLPGAGKTTFIKQLLSEEFNNATRKTVVASSDNYIELVAMEQMKTYNDVFQETIKDANEYCLDQVRTAVKERHNIIWDQTNLSIKSRKPRLAMIPVGYFRKAFVISCTTEEEHMARLAGRPGKTIPPFIIAKMVASYEVPTREEGFDFIQHVFT